MVTVLLRLRRLLFGYVCGSTGCDSAGSCFYHTHDNFLVYGGNGMKNDFGGHDNHHYSNIYAYAGQALGVTNTLEGHVDVFQNNTAVLTGSRVGGPQCKPPATVMGGPSRTARIPAVRIL